MAKGFDVVAGRLCRTQAGREAMESNLGSRRARRCRDGSQGSQKDKVTSLPGSCFHVAVDE